MLFILHFIFATQIISLQLQQNVANNAFDVPVLIPTFGLLNWTVNKIEQIDIKTRRICLLTKNVLQKL